MFYSTAYETLGCFKDTSNRAIPTLEGKDNLLNGQYQSRSDAINKCYNAAKKRGFKIFALQNGGWCASSDEAEKTFNKYGKSGNCHKNGKGGPWANQVYYIEGNSNRAPFCLASTCKYLSLFVINCFHFGWN